MSDPHTGKVRQNEYDVPESAGPPRPLYRLAFTPEKLSDILDEGMFYRNMSPYDVSLASSVPLPRVEQLLDHGQGDLDDVLSILDVLDVVAYALPPADSLRKGF